MLRAWMWTVVVACAHAYVAGGRVAVAACLVAHARARMAGSHPLRLPRVIDADDVRGWGAAAARHRSGRRVRREHGSSNAAATLGKWSSGETTLVRRRRNNLRRDDATRPTPRK